jgi:hypothetical protein
VRTACSILLAGILGLAAIAAPDTSRPPIWADLADRARGLPPEFAADALLRIAAAAGSHDLAFERQTIEDAFYLAAQSQEPFARRRWPHAAVNLFDKAYTQGLDACTLQCRAVDALLPIDYKKARELFSEIPAPRIPQPGCQDTLAPDVAIFYNTLAEVAARAFNAKEVSDEEPFHLFERYVGGANSLLQIDPAARMLAGARMNPAQLEALVASLAASLQQLSPDARSIAMNGEAGDAVSTLAAAGGGHNINVQPLLDAWRTYAGRKPDGDPCPDITEQCASSECRDLSNQFAALINGKGGFALTLEQKSAPEWGAKLREYLAALAAWKCSDDPSECFHAKGQFYGELFELAPNNLDRDLLLRSLLAWLEQNSYQHDHQVEWFYPVNTLLVHAFADPHGMRAAIDTMLNSPDPVISFYARLEQLLPRPIEKTVGLL